MTLNVLRYEGEHRLKSAFGISVAFALLAMLFVASAPLITTNIAASAQFKQVMAELPQPFIEAFGLQSMTSLGGLLAGEFYTLMWAVFFGLYLTYSAAGSVRGDIDEDRMDVLLANPVSRTTVLVETFLSLLVPILIASVITPAAIYVGTLFIDPSIAVEELIMVHVLSIPYLLCCGAIGLVLSVLLDDKDTAQNAAIGVLFALYLFQSFIPVTDYGWLANIAPMRYFDANEIMLEGTYDFTSAGILLAATLVLIAVSQVRFTRMDIQ
ncbi:ABC transporter permease subunit [Halococcus sediminicola]|uniref:ABC transporter permease subunit n=1 Tax=Halococcus sediminicola TaxID=1264579 RepID=UPI000678BE21|nr:ABC transporter permease subunit [Halococcus sediminicola]